MQHDTLTLHVLRAGLDNIGETRVKGVGEANVSNNASLKESPRSDALGAVNGLVRDDKVHGLDVFLQRANSREGNDAAHTDMTQGSDIGSVGDLVGSELVVQTVPGEESDVDALVFEDADRRGGTAPGCLEVENGDGLESLQLAEASAANDADVDRLCEIFSIIQDIQVGQTAYCRR